jgi:pimeloyl-ACP methyl ester carboxylesterase
MDPNPQVPTSPEPRNGKVHARRLSGEGAVGRPLVILHGLLGSSRNWGSTGRLLVPDRPVYALDLPDHGDSDPTAAFSFAEYARRVRAWVRAHGWEEAPDWLGHSLGGKVALRVGWEDPALVRRIVLADIFPKAYIPHLRETLGVLRALHPERFSSRSEADAALAERIPSDTFRAFLLTSLGRGEDGRLRWQVNLENLSENLDAIAGLPFPEGTVTRQPTLLVHGGRSEFVKEEDLAHADEHFTEWSAVRLPGCGHNVHIEGGPAFVDSVNEFLQA